VLALPLQTTQTTQQQLDVERERAGELEAQLSTTHSALERKRGKKIGWKGRAAQAEPALAVAQQELVDRTQDVAEYVLHAPLVCRYHPGVGGRSDKAATSSPQVEAR
jgi:hypothetical protein